MRSARRKRCNAAAFHPIRSLVIPALAPPGRTPRARAWLRHHHPGASVVLITDPWQLPRASAAFRRQGLKVQPLAAERSFSSSQRNRMALRETAGTVLYALQGRF